MNYLVTDCENFFKETEYKINKFELIFHKKNSDC